MSKFFAVVNASMQEYFQTRWHTFAWTIFGLLFTVLNYLLWSTILRHSGMSSIGGLTARGILVYYLALNILDTYSGIMWMISSDIQSGRIISFLVRPIDYILGNLAADVGSAFIRIGFKCLPVFIIGYLIIGRFFTPSLAILGVISAVLGYLIQAFLSALMGLAVVWTKLKNGLFSFYEVISGFFGGWIIPLSILPPFLYIFALLTPFPYMIFFPITVFMGIWSYQQVAAIMVFQIVWVIILSLFVKFVWQLAREHLEGVGV